MSVEVGTAVMSTTLIVSDILHPCCNRCSNDITRLSECFTLRDENGRPLLNGACAPCHWGKVGLDCSLYTSFQPDSPPHDDSEETLQSSQQLLSFSPRPQRLRTHRRAIAKRQTSTVTPWTRGNTNFKKHLIKVKKSVCADLNMSDQSLQVMNDFVNDMFNRVAEEAATITAKEKKSTLSARAIKTAFRFLLTGKLYQTAERRGDSKMAEWLKIK